MPSRRVLLTAALITGLAAGGCGGGSGSAQTAQVKQTVRRALADLARVDGRSFCALATGSGRAKLARTLPGYSCPQLIDFVGGHLSPDAKTGLLHAQVRAVHIRGSVATVAASDITAPNGSLKGFLASKSKPTRLVRQADGSWKIDA